MIIQYVGVKRNRENKVIHKKWEQMGKIYPGM